MGVVYIGDRAVGKTHLAMELANPKNEYVKVSSPDYEVLKSFLFDELSGKTRPTEALGQNTRYLEVQVRLPTGAKQVFLDWIDTAGEIWRNTWQSDNPDEWKNFLEVTRKSEGILLIVPPYREIIQPGVNPIQKIL